MEKLPPGKTYRRRQLYSECVKKKKSGQHISECSAHYDVHANKWYKYDPFDDDYSPKDDITIYVVGWADKMSAFFGVLGT